MLVKLIILIIFLIYSAGLFYGGTVYIGKKQATSAKNTQVNKLTNQESDFFANLKGSINGQIIQVNGNKLTIKTAKGNQGIFSLTEPLIINELVKNKLQPVGNTKDKIRLNENAEIKIKGLGNGFAIYAITYIKDFSIDFPGVDINEASKASQTESKK